MNCWPAEHTTPLPSALTRCVQHISYCALALIHVRKRKKKKKKEAKQEINWVLPQNCPELPACPPWAIETLVFLDCIIFFLQLFPNKTARIELLLPFCFLDHVLLSIPKSSPSGFSRHIGMHLWCSPNTAHGWIMLLQSMRELGFMINIAIHKSSVFLRNRASGRGRTESCRASQLQFESDKRGRDLSVCVCWLKLGRRLQVRTTTEREGARGMEGCTLSGNSAINTSILQCSYNFSYTTLNG